MAHHILLKCVLSRRNALIYINDFTVEITTRTVRLVTEHELALKLYQVLGDPIEKHTDLFKRGYIIVLWNTPFSEEVQHAPKIQYLNTPTDQASDWASAHNKRNSGIHGP